MAALFTSEDILSLLKKHRLPLAESQKAVAEGVVNEVWFAGDLVVRLNKDLDMESDVWTETVAVPALIQHGVKTPELLVFDSDRDVVHRLVTIYPRVPGTSLKHIQSMAEPDIFYRDLGQAVRTYHDLVVAVDDPDNRLDPAWNVKTESLYERFLSLFPEAKPWLPSEFIFEVEQTLVFCHQDLHPDNIMANEGRFKAIIDWGDAGWADRSVDFRYVPPRYLKDFLHGYGSISRQTLAQVVIHQLDQFCYAAKENKDYGPYGNSSLPDIEDLIHQFWNW